MEPVENLRQGAAVVFRRSERARNYGMRLDAEGTVVVTIPRRGTEAGARQFVERHGDWLERARARFFREPRMEREWRVGAKILWRGSLSELIAGRTEPDAAICLGSDVFRVPSLEGNLRAVLEKHFLRVAKIELPARAWELAAAAGCRLKSVSVRNQRSRWGSCSGSGLVSLNWRLVMLPEFARDYVICHELAHLREMNHSARFWAEVERLFPKWREAERVLKERRQLVGL